MRYSISRSRLRTAIIAQAYRSTSPNKTEPPSNKAAALSIAISWIFDDTVPSDRLGEKLQSAASELRDAITAGDISTIELWYVHDLPESDNVNVELRQVEHAGNDTLRSKFPEQSDIIELRALQVSRERILAWYRKTSTAILVSQEYEVDASGGWFEESGDGWRSVCLSLPASWLTELHSEHQDDLFSANVRGPLPARRSKDNINYAIGETAQNNPSRFWAYNNGLTAIVNNFSIIEGEEVPRIKISGLAIVNGAQTTGSLTRVAKSDLSGVRVLARFVQSSDANVVNDIIRFNNSQNPIKLSDYRSRDPHQDRLREEFSQIPDVTYLGARRGGDKDAPRKPSNFISADTAAQSIAAFHGDPRTAYHDLRDLWERDDKYSAYFGDHTTAPHIVFCWSLLRAVQQKKAALVSAQPEDLTILEKQTLAFLRKRGATFLLVAAIGSSIETIVDHAVTSSFRLSFGTGTSPANAVEKWLPIAEAVLPFSQQLQISESGTAFQRNDNVQALLSGFQQSVAAVSGTLRPTFATFSSSVEEGSAPPAPQ